jgi:hypothetical protein
VTLNHKTRRSDPAGFGLVAVIVRLDRMTQYPRAFVYIATLCNTGSPAFAGDDEQ